MHIIIHLYPCTVYCSEVRQKFDRISTPAFTHAVYTLAHFCQAVILRTRHACWDVFRFAIPSETTFISFIMSITPPQETTHVRFTPPGRRDPPTRNDTCATLCRPSAATHPEEKTHVRLCAAWPPRPPFPTPTPPTHKKRRWNFDRISTKHL